MSASVNKCKFIGILIFAAYSIACVAQDMKEQQMITISFEIDDKVAKMNDNCSVTVKSKDRTYNAKVKGNNLILPSGLKKVKEDLVVVFEYNVYKLQFDKIKSEWLFQNQEVNWNFVIKTPPFSDNAVKGMDLQKISAIHYWQFEPLKDGETVEIIKPILKE
jgi:hypothetical protein